MSKRQRAKSANDVLAKDLRRPILYLRSFKIEKITKAEADLGKVTVPWASHESWEEQITLAFSSKLGPVIALGNPDDRLPQLGAARSYNRDSDWFGVFQSFSSKAICIVILPSVTQGLLKELEYIKREVQSNRVFIIVPKFVFELWPSFVIEMNKLGYQIPDENLEFGSLISFTENWSCVKVGEYLESPNEYVQAVCSAINSNTETLFSGKAKVKRQTMIRSGSYKLGWWMAAIVYKLFTGKRTPKRPPE